MRICSKDVTVLSIPFFSTAAANANIDLLGPVTRVLNRARYILGEEVASFECEFAQYLGVENCVAVANGTDALELALRGIGVQKEDLVVTVANAGFYGSTAIRAIGAVPLYVDVDDDILTISPNALAEALERKPKAVIVTHLYGQLADMDKLVRITRAFGVPLVEDCAQAHGARRNGVLAGSFGAVACFSFYPTKNLGSLGDGGAVVSNDVKLASRIRMLRQYGWSQKYRVSVSGGRNSRMDEIQAAILREKLPHLDGWNADRRRIAQRYNAAFAMLPARCPSAVTEAYVAHLYVLRVKDRDTFSEFLKARGISTAVHYPVADHRQSAYLMEDCSQMTITVTETACDTVVSLPCYPGLSDDEVERVINTILEYFQY